MVPRASSACGPGRALGAEGVAGTGAGTGTPSPKGRMSRGEAGGRDGEDSGAGGQQAEEGTVGSAMLGMGGRRWWEVLGGMGKATAGKPEPARSSA